MSSDPDEGRKIINELFNETKIEKVIRCDDPIVFSFFGCWNNNQKATANIIRHISSAGDINFGIVNGDNYYSDKGTKEYNPGKVRLGFEILKSHTLTNQLFITLGNHEVDNKIPCLTLEDEMRHVHESDGRLYMNNNYSIVVNDKIMILLIDTNLFETNLCYTDESRRYERKKMKMWLRTKIESWDAEKPLFIVGHHPLFYLKKTKKIVDDKTKKMTFTINPFTLKLYDLLKSAGRPLYYLASDIHNYQCIYNKNITQIIVGTGGANFDNIPDETNERMYIENYENYEFADAHDVKRDLTDDDEVDYEIIKNSIDEFRISEFICGQYGYVTISQTEDNIIHHTFHHVPLDSTHKGGSFYLHKKYISKIDLLHRSILPK